MTALPTSADFPDGTPADKAKIRALLDGLIERGLQGMDTSLTGKGGRFIVVKADGSAIYVYDGTQVLSFLNGSIDGFGLRDGFMKIRPLSVGTAGGTANKVIDTADATEGWDVLEGSAALLTLNANVNASGFALSNLRTAGLSLLWLRIAQDGTGGRLLGGGSTVSSIFDAASHEFPVAVSMPAGASAWVELQGKKVDSGKVRWREIDRSA